MVAVTIFVLTYLGVALGRIPGLALDRVGIALLGAIAMIVSGVLPLESAVKAVDLPTILLLYALMVVSAQLRLGGFYTWAAARVALLAGRPWLFLLAGMLTSALLSAVLANDIVCFAFTPVLALALCRRQQNPLPFLLGLAVASNIGSAATLIGNPQNMLIGQVGRLPFGAFIRWCAPPALFSLGVAYLVILALYRHRWSSGSSPRAATREPSWPAFDRWQTAKGLASAGILVALFFTDVPREISAIGVAGVLLCSRRLRTRDILGLVDWHLVTLFCSLFIVIQGVASSSRLETAALQLVHRGIDLSDLHVLTAVSALLSNLVSNVPATMLLIEFLDPFIPVQWYTLALSSTFAGNLFIIGSIANLIVVEQAARFGINIRFTEHARVGIPVTLASLASLVVWNSF